MSTLTDFLLARIAEDKAQAEGDAAFYAPFTYTDSNKGVDPRAVRIAHLGEKVRVECEAKRRIVEMAQLDGLAMHERIQAEVDPVDAEDFAGGAEWALIHALRLLALPYADHPDYLDEEWKP